MLNSGRNPIFTLPSNWFAGAMPTSLDCGNRSYGQKRWRHRAARRNRIRWRLCLMIQSGFTYQISVCHTLNSTLEVAADQIPPEKRKETLEKLDGLAVFVKDKLVFTDPNGSRPWPVPILANLLPRANVDGTENYQKRALREWRNLGGDAAAMKAMEKEFSGTDLLDDWGMLVRRVTTAERIQTTTALVDALANLVSLVL